MYELMQLTAWGMEKPKAYGAFHLTFMIVGLFLCVLFAFLLRRASDRTNKIILFSCGAFLAVCEVYKQLFYTFYIGEGSYQWWIFPFQLCSVPMYLCLIVPFIKSKRVSEWIYTFLATYNLLGGFIALFEPSGLSHEYVTLTLHAFIWHILLVFIGFYIIASGRAGKKISDFVMAFAILLFLSSVAEWINTDLRMYDIKMFYISPYHSTPLAVFKSIEAKTNWLVNMVLYIFAMTAGAFVFFLVGLLVNKIKTIKSNKTKHRAIA
ncbi:MAG: YwaF family protein [Clostridia bacterium]|nr:YwaF family protein [Clostridia bacterium]